MTAGLILVAGAAMAQVEHTLPLQAGEIRVSPLSDEASARALGELAWQTEGGHVVVILDGHHRPEDLAPHGMTLLRSLGGTAWTASITPHAAASEEVEAAVSWVGALDPSWKMHPFLAAGGVPEWTMDRSASQALQQGRPFDLESLLRELDQAGDPRVVVNVLAHRDVDLDALATDVPVLTGGIVLSSLKSVHGLTIGTPMSAMQTLADDDRVLWIEPALPRLSELNDQNRQTTDVDILQDPPYGLDGEGVVVMVYDGGEAFAGHADFGGRLTVRDSSGTSDHATHVSGTIGGDGTASGGQYAGMAPAVTIQSYGFEQEGGLQEGFLYTDPGDLEEDYGDAINNHGAVIANNSIGTNTAWNGFPCEWTGDYGVTSSVIDSVVRGELGGDIRIMWANGNERGTSNCGSNYHTTAPPACAKNHITVGALNSNDESVTSFTSWGPADDGRLKPDISTAGCQSDGDGGVTSCSSGGGYSSKCGTSMASPTACGVGALLIQDWRSQYPGEPDLMNATLKALLAHTAADLGNAGPDCQYGYGSIRAQDAVDHLRTGSLLESEVSSGEAVEFLVIVDEADAKLQVTLAWDDEPATPLVIPSLVNDLDLVVIAPDGSQRFPWAINPDDPGAPATAVAADHLNNIEQVTVEGPQAGVWRVQVLGYSVPVGPQAFGVMATPDLVACSSTGIVGLDRAAYPLEGELTVTVVDCDLNTDDGVVDTVDVLVTSSDEPAGEWLTLVEEDPAASTFTGSMPHSTVDAVGTILVSHGGWVEAKYLDAQDADGNTNVEVLSTAPVDGIPPDVVDLIFSDVGPRSAQVEASFTEPVAVQVYWGTACDDTTESTVSASPQAVHSISITGLSDQTTYYVRLSIADLAGNQTELPPFGSNECWSFTTPDIPDFFTEQFTSGIDLDGLGVRFDPTASVDQYTACAEPMTAFPVDPAGGTSVSLGDDDAIQISPAQPVTLYGESWDSLWIGSNGMVTFGAANTSYTESIAAHFGFAGVSMLWDDLNPSAGGTISWKDLSDGVAVTWQNVPEYSSSNSNSFQVVFRTSGSIHCTWLGIDAGDAVIGLSAGDGQDPDFQPTDLSESTLGCGPQPPSAHGQVHSVLPGSMLDITLTGSDDGLPDPPGALAFIIDTLPSHPLRDMQTGDVIESGDLPYTLSDAGLPALRYEPPGIWEGYDDFMFHVDDGGAPPTGGPSAMATVSITVADGPQVVYDFPLDTDPGWDREGLWAFGQPTGGGGQYGNPDPTSGATGPNVLGYNLDGDYENGLPERFLTTESLDCSQLTDVELHFMRYLNVEQPSYDHAYVRVSVGGGSWQTVWENGAAVTDSGWSEQVIDLSAIADGQPDVQIAWVMGSTDSSWQFSGWNIDDVQIVAVAPSAGVPGDLNGDGMVGTDDLLIVIAEWGPCPPGPCDADLNGDGIVGADDLLFIIANWGGGGLGAPRSGGQSQDGPDDAAMTPLTPLQPAVLINEDVLRPADGTGLVVTAGGYLQRPWAVLDLEVAGEVPIRDRDLLIIGEVAQLDGRLVIRLTDEGALPPGQYALLVAAGIEGEFAEMVVIDPLERGSSVCWTEHAITLVVPPTDASETPTAAVSDLLQAVRRLGQADRRWDLDQDGVVTELDLIDLLGGECR
ncbi:MAG: S8 family serine peptidase [Phycisphaerales bacterium]|nr:S8 family serine peptidase [Phycisphaerales bacterium]